MLTADLVRASVKGGEVRPGYLPLSGRGAQGQRERAQQLIELFQAHVGRTRGEVDAAVEEGIAGRPDFKIGRGLVKLLEDKSEFSGLDSETAIARRRAVFAAAAAARRSGDWDRGAVLTGVALDLEQPPEVLEQELYADLKENEVLRQAPALSAGKLLQRYNLALAQAVLLRALSLEIEVEAASPPRLRQLLRQAKFHGLLQDARREGPVVRLQLDGPMSIFSATPRYGVRMAGFLPALLLCERWSLTAQVQFGRGRRKRTFRLGPGDGLVTHARDHGAWLPELIEAFQDRFREVAPEYDCDTEVPLLNLGGELIVPDFRFTHRESGWQGWLEVLGYWRKGGVARRLEALREHDAPRLVLALEKGLKLGAGDVKGLTGPVVPYREIPDARKVRKRLEELRTGGV